MWLLKTHPDILPFEELPKNERDKDAIFFNGCLDSKKTF